MSKRPRSEGVAAPRQVIFTLYDDDMVEGELFLGKGDAYTHNSEAPTADDLWLVRRMQEVYDDPNTSQEDCSKLLNTWSSAIETRCEHDAAAWGVAGCRLTQRSEPQGELSEEHKAQHEEYQECVQKLAAVEPQMDLARVLGWHVISEAEFKALGACKFTFMPSWD